MSAAGGARTPEAGREACKETWRRSKRRAHGASLVAYVLRLQLRGVVWGVSLGLLSVLTVASFPSIGQDPQLNEIIQNYPPEMRELFGLREGPDFSTIEGFLGSRLFNLLVPLALAFFPILASAGAIAGAEERGTIDVLRSNPIPRCQLVLGSFFAMAFSLLGILAILGLFTWVPALLLNVDLSARTTAEAVLNLWPLYIFFGGLAMLCSTLFRRRVLAIAIPRVALVAMYFVNGLGNVVEKLKDVRPFTIFYYYGSAMEDGIEWASFGGVTLTALALVLLAVLVFSRRDIYT